MKEKEIINLIKKKFKHLKNSNLDGKSDLISDYILDSLELMVILTTLEKKKLLKIRNFTKEENNFKISTITKHINSRK